MREVEWQSDFPGTRGERMTKRGLITIILATTLSITFGASAILAQTASPNQNSPAPLKIGIVSNRDSFDGPGCSLQLPANYRKHNQRYTLLSDSEDNAVMNFDGKDMNLRLVCHREPRGPSKKGDRSNWTYSRRGITVRVDFVVTGLCPPNDEGCEVIYYDAAITVTRGTNKQLVMVKGVCGS